MLVNPLIRTLTSIEATWVEVEQFSPQLSLRAKTEANRVVDVKAQVGGRISCRPVEEGAQVVAGDTLCKIDAEDRAQRIEHAAAALAQAKIEYNGALKLKQSGYQSELAIAQAKTRLEVGASDRRAQRSGCAEPVDKSAL